MTRAVSASDSGVRPRPGRLRRTFMLMWVRSWAKPECISADTERASARAARSCGQSPGCDSARYSRMASESQTRSSPPAPGSTRQGTLPAGLNARMRCRDSGWYSGMRTSSKAMPATFIAIQGRRDHEE